MGKHIVDDDEDVDVGLDDFEGEDGTEDAPEIPVETESDEPTEAKPAQERGKTETADSAASEAEDEVESYSKRVQKRINKLTGNVKRLEQETNYWKERVAALESKHSAKEMSDFQSSLAESETKLMANYKAAQADYKKAVEEGDVDAQIEIQEKVLDLREQLAEKRRMAAIAKEQAEKIQQPQQPARPAPAASESAAIPEHLPTGTKAWLKENAWFMKGADAKAANYARTLDAELQEEGYSPDDPAMYAELNKRLRVLVPRLAAKIRDVAVAGKSPTPPRARVAGSSPDGQRGGSEPASGTKPKRVLTTDDVSAMRRYGMDPKNVDHRKAWLRRNDPL